MAEIKKMVGFVNDWNKTNPQHPDWAMKVGEPHRKKLPTGEYETVGTTYWTIKNGWDEAAGKPANIDFTQFSVGDRVEVSGTSVSEKWERDGKKGSTLVLKATSVSFVVSKVAHITPQAGTVERGYEKAVTNFDAELPF
jgi:hypothetical protein